MARTRFEYLYEGKRERLELFGFVFLRGVPLVTAHAFGLSEMLDLERYGVRLIRTFEVQSSEPPPLEAKTTIQITKRKGRLRGSY